MTTELVTRQVAADLSRRRRPPGLSVAVVGNGAQTWSDGFGLADLETGQAAARHTIYLWFSMTKLVTATAVVQLAERGRLALDDPVRNYVPEFSSGERGRRVTLRHLLSHSAGLVNPIPLRWVRPAEAPAEDLHAFTERLLARHSRLRRIRAEPLTTPTWVTSCSVWSSRP